ncbi:MAG: substrate-binding domain-containing protein [Lachnospiraceae bacterium]|jgi:LacI family transcriptional regulator|nr:substrate-binding domain-containing protein [Lachnospiraceae bacterium]
MSVTIKMIAEKCGVSRGTVDRVLNHRGRVSQETIRKVNAVVEELGYQPNTIGRALALHKKELKIGIILCSLGNEFYDEMIEGIWAARKENHNYDVEILMRCMKGYDVEEQLSLMDELKRQVQCLILNAIDDFAIVQKIDEYMDDGIGVFTINTDVTGSRRMFHVGVDVMECGRIACGLISMFCRERGRVLIVTGSLSLLEHRNRIMGFCTAMDSRYPGIKLAEIIETQDDDEEAYRGMKEFLGRNKEIQAVFVSAGGSVSVCQALKEAGMEHTWVVVCDMIPAVKKLMEEKRIQAAIVQQPWQQGYRALDLAVHYLIEGSFETNFTIENEIKLFENM